MKLSESSLLVVAVVVLSSCSSLKFESFKRSGPVQVSRLSVLNLANDKAQNVKGYLNHNERRQPSSHKHWQYRNQFALGTAPQNSAALTFIQSRQLVIPSYGRGLSLVDTNLGNVQWDFAVEPGVSSKPFVTGNHVIFSGLDRLVRKIKISDASLVWERKISAESHGGVVGSRGFVYVSAGDNSLWALDEKTGNILWTYRRPSSLGSVMWSLKGQMTPILSRDASKIFMGFSDGYVVALEATSGSTIWEKSFSNNRSQQKLLDVDLEGTLSKDGKKLWISQIDGDLWTLDTSSGRVLWSIPGPVMSAPYIDEKEGVAYISTKGNKLLKVEFASKLVHWEKTLGNKGFANTPIDLGPKFIAFTSSHHGLMIVDRKTGKDVYSDYVGSGLVGKPVFDGRRLFFMDSRNRLHAYSLRLRKKAAKT